MKPGKKPGKVLKSLAKLKHRVDAVQAKLKSAKYDGTAAGGAVTLTLAGTGELVSIHINPMAIAEGAETLAALVQGAFKDAYDKKESAAKAALREVGAGPETPFGAGL